MFKIELENSDFLYSGRWEKIKIKKILKNGLRLGAGIILNQELTYSRHWAKMGCGRLPAP